jgi:hypothetical protein
MAGFKLMAKMTPEEYKTHIVEGTLLGNLRSGKFGTPIYLKSATLQTIVKPITNLDNPMYYHPNQQSNFIANNTLPQSNYANTRRMK